MLVIEVFNSSSISIQMLMIDDVNTPMYAELAPSTRRTSIHNSTAVYAAIVHPQRTQQPWSVWPNTFILQYIVSILVPPVSSFEGLTECNVVYILPVGGGSDVWNQLIYEHVLYRGQSGANLMTGCDWSAVWNQCAVQSVNRRHCVTLTASTASESRWRRICLAAVAAHSHYIFYFARCTNTLTYLLSCEV